MPWESDSSENDENPAAAVSKQVRRETNRWGDYVYKRLYCVFYSYTNRFTNLSATVIRD